MPLSTLALPLALWIWPSLLRAPEEPSGPHADRAASAAPIVREGEHFRALCHGLDAELADQALAAVEALWPAASKLYPVERLAALLEVNLYANEQDYHAADLELSGGRFARNLAFSHHASMTAHVALQPRLTDEALERLGLPFQTQRLLAHEAAHLLRYASFSNYRSHPGWLADGAAQWLSIGKPQARWRARSVS